MSRLGWHRFGGENFDLGDLLAIGGMRKPHLELRERFLDLPGVRLHVVEAGPSDGKPVLLLHGFPEFWWGWRQQIPALAAAGRRVVVPDLRGYNLSGKPRGIRAYGLDPLTDDLQGLLDDLGPSPADVVGRPPSSPGTVIMRYITRPGGTNEAFCFA